MIKGTTKSAATAAASTVHEQESPVTGEEGFSTVIPAEPVGSGLNIAQQIGQLLRQTRESRGVTFEEASRQTRIRIAHLQAIEAGEIGALPGPAFVIGFLRLYVKFLNVSEKETVDRFVEQWHQEDGFLATQFFPPPHNTSRSRPTAWMVVLGILGLVALIAWYSNSSMNLRLFGQGLGGGSRMAAERTAMLGKSPGEEAYSGEDIADISETDIDGDDQSSVPGSSPFIDGTADVQGGGEEDDIEPEQRDEDEEDENPDSRVLAPPKPGPLVIARQSGTAASSSTSTSASASMATTAARSEMKPSPGGVEPNPSLATKRPGEPVAITAATRPEMKPGSGGAEPNPSLAAKRPGEPVATTAATRPEMKPGPGGMETKPSLAAKHPGERIAIVDDETDGQRPPAVSPGATLDTPAANGPAHAMMDRVPTENNRRNVAGSIDAAGVRVPTGKNQQVLSGQQVLPDPGSGVVSETQGVGASTLTTTDVSGVESGSRTGSRVTLVATEETWVSVRDADGQQIKNRVMKPGERFEIPGGGKYTALLGNAGGVQFLVDGRSLPPLGRRGEVVRNLDVSPKSLLHRFPSLPQE
ncbi:MAG: DUF4115 domain-containing protein [Magnetococcus sp. DMHC-1]|nr:DUF4115 domain-containing protein [Magnetococcales bacterium]